MKIREIFQYAFSTIILLATLFWFGMLFFFVVPEGNKELVTFAAGIFLGSGWTQILGWWFGSSKGSADKTENQNKTAELNAQNSVSITATDKLNGGIIPDINQSPP